jgi:hypothetical protein
VAWGRHCSWASTRHASPARGTSSDVSEPESVRYSQRLKKSFIESLARQTAGGVEVELKAAYTSSLRPHTLVA